ncbi:hypothetical protein ABKN59_011471 [Abortiporus biennis]
MAINGTAKGELRRYTIMIMGSRSDETEMINPSKTSKLQVIMYKFDEFKHCMIVGHWTSDTEEAYRGMKADHASSCNYMHLWATQIPLSYNFKSLGKLLGFQLLISAMPEARWVQDSRRRGQFRLVYRDSTTTGLRKEGQRLHASWPDDDFSIQHSSPIIA